MYDDTEVSTMPGTAEVAPSNGGPQVLQPSVQENPTVQVASGFAPQEIGEEVAPARPRRSPAKVKGKTKTPKGKKVKITGKTKAKAKAAGAGRPAILQPSATLTVLAKKNPWRPGSKAQVEFDKFKTGATVAATLKRGVRPRFLLWSRKLKHVKISA